MKRKRMLLCLLMVFLLLFQGCAVSGSAETPESSSAPMVSGSAETSENAAVSQGASETAAEERAVKDLEVHFIDVGQADCVLLDAEGHYMLIDAGNDSDDSMILQYLRDEGVRKLDYLIGTHPHEDHIGAMDSVIQAFDVERFIMPKVSHDTQAFENLLDTVIEKEVAIARPVPNKHFLFNGLKVEVLGPRRTYEDLNNNSIVLRVTNGETKFLFTGDAEDISEFAMIDDGCDLDADVLKVGHHGSDTSATGAFLSAVTPTYAVISVGAGNSYGHPDSGVLQRIKDIGAEIYRTDLNGTIVIKSDGEDMKVSCEKTEEASYGPSAAAMVEETYIGNKNTYKFHLDSCSSLPKGSNRVYMSSRDEAMNRGFVPCKRCNP